MAIVLAVMAAIVVAILVIFPTVRRIAKITLTLAITLGASAIAIGGLAILMNNVGINEQPGVWPRVYRFLTVNWAATSAKGTGMATCQEGAAGARSRQSGAPVAAARPRGGDRRSAPGQPTATPSAASAGTEEDVYPELIRRGYPGLSRATLFALAKETVSELGGWQVVKEEPRAYTLECIYATRLLKFEDEVKIVVTPRSEIDLCSHSGVGEGGTGIPGWLFSGDFGANIGHIKEFYSALEPRVDQAYKEQERKLGEPR